MSPPRRWGDGANAVSPTRPRHWHTSRLPETVRLWRASDGQLINTLNISGVWRVALSPDGQTLASGLNNGTVRLWRVSDGELINTLEEHTENV
jgi:WD40 repeat protein